MRSKLVIIVVACICFFCGSLSTASAHSLTATQKMEVKKRFYHADGYIKAIGKNARRTIYHPNPKVSNKWHDALRYLIGVRHRAWIVLHPPAPKVSFPSWLMSDFNCIHRYEGAWNDNTGNGYYGGLQMDWEFQSLYGTEFLQKYGTADKWPVWAQMTAAIRAYNSGRGFGPWPNTARTCGLL